MIKIEAMLKYAFLLLSSVVFSNGLFTQTITGNLSAFNSKPIELEGFNGLETYPISSTRVDSSGHFVLSYSARDYGVGMLRSDDASTLILLLSGEYIEIKGESLDAPMSISIIQGHENQWMQQYGKEHPRRERALSVWTFLKSMYTSDSLFSLQQVTKTSIQNEIQRLQNEDASYMDRLPKDSYVRWYIPVRKLVSSVSTIALYRTEEIPETIEAFRELDYSDTRLYKSGLFQDAIDNHFWLLANSGLSLDSTFIEMQKSIAALIENLVDDEQKLNEVTEHLFDLLERHSLFEASEYLALKVLNETTSTIDNDLAKQLEAYRAMKIGNIAPDILLHHNVRAPGHTKGAGPARLSDMNSNYTLVIFGASWCPKCKDELPEILKLYPVWKEQGVEVCFAG